MPSLHVQHLALSHSRKDAGSKAVKCLSRIEPAAVAEAGEDVADYPCALRGFIRCLFRLPLTRVLTHFIPLCTSRNRWI